jgi:hypothetical protein
MIIQWIDGGVQSGQAIFAWTGNPAAATPPAPPAGAGASATFGGGPQLSSYQTGPKPMRIGQQFPAGHP